MTLPRNPLTATAPARKLDARPAAPPQPATTAGKEHTRARPVEVLAYYFPQWHADPTNDAMNGPGWTEWDVLRRGTPRFHGHVQPKQPLWGEADESDPAHASRVIAAALDHGLTGFLVDWYWYDNHPFLNGALDRGLLHADRIAEFRFALMWANHDWTQLFPAHHPDPGLLLPAPNSRYHVRDAFRHVIDSYLHHPSYWQVDGAPYFSLYDLPGFIRGMGSVEEGADVLAQFRADVHASGLPGLHLNGVTTFQISDPAGIATQLGLDSVTHYTWWHHPNSGFDTFPTSSYDRTHERARAAWQHFDRTLPVPYLPNVTVGWDPSPRTVEWPMDRERGYPFTSILTGNTPKRVAAALRDAVEFVASRPSHRIVTINAWNEWTEGSYLEPDREHGFTYLNEIKHALDTTTRPASAARKPA